MDNTTFKLIFFQLIIFSFIHLTLQENIIILKPSDGKSQDFKKLIVFVPGGLVPNENYIEIAKSIQNQYEYQLWFGIITCQWTKNLCDPLDPTPFGVNYKINQLIQQANQTAGNIFQKEDIFIAGHSLGGIGAHHFATINQGYAGVILLGSYIDRDLQQYSTPVLTLGAELDGGAAKPARLNNYFESFQNIILNEGLFKALSTKPVIIIPGIDHSDFCPGFKVKGDLPTESTQEQSLYLISDVITQFLYLRTNEDINSTTIQNAFNQMKNYLKDTENMLKPIYIAKQLDQNLTWCQIAQRYIAGLSEEDNKNLIIEQLGVIDSQTNLEHAHPQYNKSNGEMRLKIGSYVKYQSDYFNFTSTYVSPIQIQCKMLSSQKITSVFNKTAQYPDRNCQDVNQLAIQLAKSLLSDKQLSRFNQKGKKFILEKDIRTLIGPQWVFVSQLSFKEDANSVHIASPFIYSDIKSQFYPGSYYCSLLTPSRALEWLMTNGYTDKYE